MRKSRLFILGLLFVADLSRSSSYARDYTGQGLPEGARARLGKGSISGDIMFSPDGTVLAVPCSAGVWLYDVETGAEINLLIGHTKQVSSIAFSADGTKIAGLNRDNSIRLWDVRTGKSIHTLAGHTDSVDAIVFSPDGSTLASRSRGKIIRLWDVDTGEPVFSFERHQRWLSSIVFLPDGSTLVGDGTNRTIHSRNVSVVEVVPSLEGYLDAVKSVAFSPDGATLAIDFRNRSGVWGDESTIRLWDTRTGEILHTLARHWNV